MLSWCDGIRCGKLCNLFKQALGVFWEKDFPHVELTRPDAGSGLAAVARLLPARVFIQSVFRTGSPDTRQGRDMCKQLGHSLDQNDM